MMETHLCDPKKLPSLKKIKELIKGRYRTASDEFSCGGCSKTFQSICVLHYHCMKHANGGSYFFDHVTKTAFPKHDSICSYTQVNENLICDFILGKTREGERVLFATAKDMDKDISDGHIALDHVKTELTDSELDASDIEQDDDQVNLLKDNVAERIDCEDVNEKVSGSEEERDDGVVTIRNVKRASDGSLSFEIDEKDKHLFDRTANGIMERIQQEGEGWIGNGDEVKIKLEEIKARVSVVDSITNKAHESEKENNICTSQKPHDSGIVPTDSPLVTSRKMVDIVKEENLDKNDELVRNKEKLVGSSEEKVDTSNEEEVGADKESNIHSEKKRKRGRPRLHKVTDNASVIKIKRKRGRPRLDEVTESDNTSVTCKETKRKGNSKQEKTSGLNDDNKNTDLEIFHNARRSSRKRQVSTRLKDSDFDTPKKLKGDEEDKKTMSPRKANDEQHQNKTKKENKQIKQIPIIRLVKLEESSEVNVKRLEQKNKKLPTNTSLIEEKDEKEPDESTDPVLLEENKEADKVSTDTTHPAELSASEILLSLSKANKQDQKDMEDTTIDSVDVTSKKKQVKSQKSTRKTGKTAKATTDIATETDKDINKSSDAREDGSDRILIEQEIPPHKRKDYKCKTCGKEGGLAMIKYHEECHSNEKPYTCEVCGKGFKTRPCLVAHVRQHGEWTFKCDRCPATFYRKQYLTSHMKKHTGEKPFQCELCPKSFREKYILKRHVNNFHKNIRKFSCDICNMMFFRPLTRDVHRMRHFDPTLKCHYCPKMFKAEMDRSKHELTHTHEKQFVCPKCLEGFAQSWPYQRHMWKKHNICKEDAKKIQIRNKPSIGRRIPIEDDTTTSINTQEALENDKIAELDIAEDLPASHDITDVPVVEDNQSINIIFDNKMDQADIDAGISQLKDGQIVIHQNDGLVPQPGEEFIHVLQPGEENVIQPTDTSQVTELKGIYEHLYVTDHSSMASAIQVLTGNQSMEEGTVIMETREENPETGAVSVVQQNIVILSDYVMEEPYPEIDGYSKEYSTLDI